jgi:anti-sigma B factor antagonist
MTEQEQQHQIDVNRTEAAAIVAIRGEHDLYTAPALREQLSALVADGQAVVVDLSGCTFIDSSILGVLLGALRRTREAGSAFVVVLGDGEPAVRRIFEVTGLFGVFTVCDTLEEAVAATRDGGE